MIRRLPLNLGPEIIGKIARVQVFDILENGDLDPESLQVAVGKILCWMSTPTFVGVKFEGFENIKARHKDQYMEVYPYTESSQNQDDIETIRNFTKE